MTDISEFEPFTSKKLRIYGELWNPEDKRNRPNLHMSVSNNSPRFKVYMNDGKNEAPIAFVLDPFSAQTFFELWGDTIDNPEASRSVMELKSCFNYKGARTEKAAPIANIMVGRNSEGLIYLAFQAIDGDTSTGMAIFNLRPNYFAEIFGADGEKITEKRGSDLMARGIRNLLSRMMATHLIVRAVEPMTSSFGGGGRQQSPQQPRSSGGGGNGMRFDNDVPF